ncbi:MAG: hypothetical protein DRG66_01565 [Deltaproteobacteria bacterium]|nr:MAG: hypothetical protein DRG66_01565 [Deltaproteobacteria bacterium]
MNNVSCIIEYQVIKRVLISPLIFYWYDFKNFIITIYLFSILPIVFFNIKYFEMHVESYPIAFLLMDLFFPVSLSF